MQSASDRSDEFWANVQGFVQGKLALDATAEAVLPQNYMSRFPSFKNAATQSPLDESDGATMSLDDVYAAANKARPMFEEVMKSIARGAGLDPSETVHHHGEPLAVDPHHAPGQFFTRVTIAPHKGRARAEEKVKDDYNGDNSSLVDVVRCSIVVSEEPQLLTVAEALRSCTAPGSDVEFEAAEQAKFGARSGALKELGVAAYAVAVDGVDGDFNFNVVGFVQGVGWREADGAHGAYANVTGADGGAFLESERAGGV